MEYVLVWLVGSAISAVFLVIAMLVVQRIADLPIPPLGEFALKVAVVTFGANAV